MIHKIPQHSPANLRKRTDEYLEPANLKEVIKECIEQEDALQRYKVTVTDDELVEERLLTNNAITFGDALEKVLQKKLSRYKALSYWNKINKPIGMRFENAYHDIAKGVTHYYYRLGVDEKPTEEEILEAL